MSLQTYDPSSKWILKEQGRSVLWLAGERNVQSCQAQQAEVVEPRKLPDGLLHVQLVGQKKPSLVLVEVATYPEKRVVDQMQDGIRLVRQARGVLPEALVICLHPGGNYRVPDHVQETSQLGWTGSMLSWKVVEVWTLSAEELLDAPDVGVVLWALLARYDGHPRVLLERCRARIEREGGKRKDNLLAVAQVFARLKYNEPELLEILGGRKTMIESPLIQEIVEESERAGCVKTLVEVLKGRFGAVTPTIKAGLEQIKEMKRLVRLTPQAVNCADLEAFEKALLKELPARPAPSTRGKRRSRKKAEE